MFVICLDAENTHAAVQKNGKANGGEINAETNFNIYAGSQRPLGEGL